ncbi:MAG: helix-turn-helix domain-containing protein [Candidatus Acidiferrales bacterium]
MTVLEKYKLDRPTPTVIASEAQHQYYTAVLTELELLNRPTAEDRKYANVLAALIEKYEGERYPIESVEPVEIRAELISANDLRQKDLAALLGGERGVSAILNGDRRINMDQAFRLGECFKVSPMLFMSTKMPKHRHSSAVR